MCEECNTLHVTYCQEGCDTLTVLPTGYTCNAGDYTCPPMKGCVVTG